MWVYLSAEAALAFTTILPDRGYDAIFRSPTCTSDESDLALLGSQSITFSLHLAWQVGRDGYNL